MIQSSEVEPSRTLVFTSAQLKYGHDQNWSEPYHLWLDRPLITDRYLSEEGFGPGRQYHSGIRKKVTGHPFTSVESLHLTLNEISSYGLDGVSWHPQTADRMELFGLLDDAIAENNMENLMIMPEFTPGYAPKDSFESYAQVVEHALASPNTPRIDGKVVIASYNGDLLTPEEWQEILDYVRSRHGDTFLFLPALARLGGGVLGEAHRRGVLTEDDLEKARAEARAYLDVADGIYFHYPPAMRIPDKFPRVFNREFYEDVFIPLWQGVLSEPGYEGKLLGLSAYRAHSNPDHVNALQEDGTRTLRNVFEPAMNAGADIIILPEWDEQNENTSFRPTVYNSWALQRILRYYMSQIRGEDPTPVLGDDTNIPNLIISPKHTVVLGEEALIELLNVPDSIENEIYRVTVTLLDENRNLLQTYGPYSFNSAKLQEERILVPTEDFPYARALLPIVSIEGYKGNDMSFGEGLPFVRVRATWNSNPLFVKQPLRDLLDVEEFSLEIETEAQETGRHAAQVSIRATEPQAQLELLADDMSVFEYDPEDAYFRSNPDYSLFLIRYRSLNAIDDTKEIEGVIWLDSEDVKWWFYEDILHRPEAEFDIKNGTVRFWDSAWLFNRWIYLALPREKAVNKQLNFDVNGESFSVPLKNILDQGIYVHDMGDGLQIAVLEYVTQIDSPSHLAENDVSFETWVKPTTKSMLYSARAISQNGKLFRSHPVSLSCLDKADLREIGLFSDARQEAIKIMVDECRLPNIEYIFEPGLGAVLTSTAGMQFWASLGGYVNMLTGQGGYTRIFLREFPGPTMPQWREVDGNPALFFDGEDMFLKLPPETIPYRSSFKIEMEIKPTGGDDYVLLFTGDFREDFGLRLEVVDNILYASFRMENLGRIPFNTNLSLLPNEWNKLTVGYNYRTIDFIVNGREQKFNLTSKAMIPSRTYVGNSMSDKPSFEGFLRSLRIQHGY